MARIARIVVPGYPHHITQRGNRRQETFFCDDDYRQYIDVLKPLGFVDASDRVPWRDLFPEYKDEELLGVCLSGSRD